MSVTPALVKGRVETGESLELAEQCRLAKQVVQLKALSQKLSAQVWGSEIAQ